MKIEQAIYGEVRGGHGLRIASNPNGTPDTLTARLDLPDTVPPGVDWSPFLSGFPLGDRYVLARTYADPHASRAGMVLSHALIAPLAEMVTLSDLRPVLGLLITDAQQPAALRSCEVLPESSSLPAHAPDLVPAAEALVARQAGQVVRLGLLGFEELVVAVWARLWPELRERFAFRLSFGPQDLVESPSPALVCTPNALAARWDKHRIISAPNDSPVSPAAAILCGGAEATSTLAFARRIGARLDSFGTLPMLERAYALASQTVPTFDECVRAIRLVEPLSPEKDVGLDGKADLVARLASQMRTATAADVLLLRNVAMPGFATAHLVWESLENWLAHHRLRPADDRDMLLVLAEALSGSAVISAWKMAILRGVAAAARSQESAFPAAFWRWVEANPPLVTALATLLPGDAALEARLRAAAPAMLHADAGHAMMAIGQAKGWLTLHGAAAGACLPVHAAIARQLEVDPRPDSVDGLRAVSRCVRPEMWMTAALASSEARVLGIAAELAAQRPQLLKNIDAASSAAQEIWAQALAINCDAWKGPADPRAALHQVLRNLMESRFASPALLLALSESPLADLSACEDRAEVWRRVDKAVRDNFLLATAAGWLQDASKRNTPPDAPDTSLEAAILGHADLDAVLRVFTASGVTAAIRVISALANFHELRFIHWLNAWSDTRVPLAPHDAEAIGVILRARRWKDALDVVVRLVRSGRHNLQPAVRPCQDLLGYFNRWGLGLTSESSEDKWAAFETLALELYPGGPDDSGLWSRAGGQDAYLEHFGSGSSRWRHAIAKMRHGGGLHVSHLLDVMREDYPGNRNLTMLAQDPYFGIRLGRATADTNPLY